MFYKGLYKMALVAAIVELMKSYNTEVVVLAKFEHHEADSYTLVQDKVTKHVTIKWGEETRGIETLRIKNLEHLIDAIRARSVFDDFMMAVYHKAQSSLPSCACALIEIGTEDEE